MPAAVSDNRLRAQVPLAVRGQAVRERRDILLGAGSHERDRRGARRSSGELAGWPPSRPFVP